MANKKNLKILIACGGTGGHVFPAIGLADAIREGYPHTELLFTGVFKPHLERVLKAAGYKIFQAAGFAMPYRFNILVVPFLINMSFSLKKAFSILKQCNPDIVVSMGSFSGAPFVVAAKLKSLPVLIHEQNVAPGRANRISAYFADKIATGFEATADFFPETTRHKIVCTGNPVRKEILALQPNVPPPRWDNQMSHLRGGTRFSILVMGGSQGAHTINMVFMEAASALDKDRFEILHLAGKDDYEILSGGYQKLAIKNKVFVFLDDIAQAYAASDLVISRAGAITATEIVSLGMASILIPYPYGDSHQKKNAQVLKDAGAAIVIEEKALTKERLVEAIKWLSQNQAKLDEMKKASSRLARPDAAGRLAKEVMELVKLD